MSISTPKVIDSQDSTPPAAGTSRDMELRRHHLVVGGWVVVHSRSWPLYVMFEYVMFEHVVSYNVIIYCTTITNQHISVYNVHVTRVKKVL